MKYYLIAGEASGDLHASNLMKAIKERDPNAAFRCWGGDLMKKQGGDLVKHYRDLDFMGFVEVLLNLKTVLGNLKFCREDILNFQPDALILIDYPGFNLRIAEFAHHAGFKVFYYISPQIWAWKQSRVKKIKAFVNKMFVILPFEKDFYAKHGYNVDFVGHPLLDAIDNFEKEQDSGRFHTENGLDSRPVIALLPGSRKQEVSKMLSDMLRMVDHFPDYQFVIAGVATLGEDFYKEITGQKQVKVLFNQTYLLLRNAYVALVTSGTATLETALFGVPEVVCYRGSRLSYQIAKRIIKVKYISLVNLVMDRPVVKELIQQELNERKLKQELSRMLQPLHREKLSEDYKLLKEKLGGSGASAHAAEAIVNAIVKKS